VHLWADLVLTPNRTVRYQQRGFRLINAEAAMRRFRGIIFAYVGVVTAGIVILPVATQAQTVLRQKRVLTLEAARRVVAAAEVEAQRNGSPCVIAVVDDAGWLILLERMDNAPMLASVELAPGKARAAAIYRKPTQVLEETINRGRTAAITAPFVQMQGGLPLTVEGEVVGAIGVSADTPAHDQQIAEAGARALAP
jgi:glc operon protein GlcG